MCVCVCACACARTQRLRIPTFARLPYPTADGHLHDAAICSSLCRLSGLLASLLFAILIVGFTHTCVHVRMCLRPYMCMPAVNFWVVHVPLASMLMPVVSVCVYRCTSPSG